MASRKFDTTFAKQRAQRRLRPRQFSADMGRAVNEARRLSEQAYQGILQGLFEGRIPVGAFVTQNQLIALLGIPVQPLRDALLVLGAEGVLTVHPRSGIQFLRVDSELARTTYQFRSIIERASVRSFAVTGDASVIAGLRADQVTLQRQIKVDGTTARNREVLGALDEQLHATIVSVLRNPMVDIANRRLDNYVTILHLKREVTQPLAMQTVSEHLAILDACAERNADRAEAAMAAHLQAALLRILTMV